MTIEKLKFASMPQNDGMIGTGEECEVPFQRPVVAGDLGAGTVKDNAAQTCGLECVLPGTGRIGGEGHEDMASVEPKHSGSCSMLVEAGEQMALGEKAFGKSEWFERNRERRGFTLSAAGDGYRQPYEQEKQRERKCQTACRVHRRYLPCRTRALVLPAEHP